MEEQIKTIDEMKLTPKEREEHFFRVGYEYAILHLQLGLKEDKLEGLEKTLMKHLNFLKK